MRSTEELIRALENARQQLSDISDDAKQYSDVAPAYERVGRWKERTVRVLYESVSKTEGDKLNDIRSPGGLDLIGQFRNHVKMYDAALLGIIETLNYYPTFYRPDGSSSAGTSDEIETRGVEYKHDIFISYSSLDQNEAGILHQAITDAGKLAFLSAKSLNPGEDFADEIRRHLIGSRQLWLLVSPNSLKSEWVLTEWGAAWVLRKRIVPILHRCSPEQLPLRLRSIHSIDFHKYSELIKTLLV